MLHKTLIVLLLCITGIMQPATANAEVDLEKIDKLMAEGDYEQAQKEVQHARRFQSSSDRLVVWDWTFQGRAVQIAFGKKLFYTITYGRTNITKEFHHDLSCYSIESGLMCWRNPITTFPKLAVDPRDDTLYTYEQKGNEQTICRISPFTGRVLEDFQFTTDQGRIQGILVGPYLVSPNTRFAPAAEIPVFDTQLEKIDKIKVSDFWLLAPDESHRLQPVGGRPYIGGWRCIIEGKKRQEKWTFSDAFSMSNRPIWYDNNPLFVAGDPYQRGVVTYLDLATGKSVWSTTMGWGTYTANLHQMRNGSYPSYWTPLSFSDDYILSLDDSGRLYVLNSEDGREEAVAKLSRDYVVMPTIYNGRLIVASRDWIRSYTLKHFLNPDACKDVALTIRLARICIETGTRDTGIQLIDQLVDYAPHSALAWAARAEIFQAMGNREEASYSRCMSLAAAGKTSDQTLRNKCGLLRLYDLKAKPAWPLVLADDQIYIGTMAGTLWAVRTDNLECKLSNTFAHEIRVLKTRTELEAVDGTPRCVQRTIEKKPVPPDKVPGEWNLYGGIKRFGFPVSYRGRQFRPYKGGVRVLDGSTMTDIPSPLGDFGEWKIHIGPAGPIGYGSGLYELDKDLRPVRKLTEPIPADGGVMYLSSTIETIGAVVAGRAGVFLHVYSYDGKLLNEVPLDPNITFSSWNLQPVIAVGDGYLFADRHLTWVNAQENNTWRFGPPLDRTNELKRDRQRYFGDPLLVNGCVYVTDYGGRLYIFDAAAITGEDN